MENETKYKFELIWISILSLLMIFCFYKLITIYNANLSLGLYLVLVFPVLVLSYFILPMAFSMLRGIPAIALTDNYFIDNIGGHSIEWRDIMEMHLTINGQRSGPSLVVNLKQPEKYFNTPHKKMYYKLRQLFTANDISIKMDLVAGNNQEIFQVIQAYWSKHDAKVLS